MEGGGIGGACRAPCGDDPPAVPRPPPSPKPTIKPTLACPRQAAGSARAAWLNHCAVPFPRFDANAKNGNRGPPRSPHVQKLLVLATLTIVVLAGCLGASGPEGDAAGGALSGDWPRCEHPWPCADGSEWPPDLAGPFDIREPEDVRITSHDGIVLHGTVWRPQLPDGVAAPVVVYSSPYFSQNTNNDPTDGGSGSTSYPGQMDLGHLRQFPENGFALLLISVRGTGESGGCLGWSSPDEQKDHGEIVDWAAEQPWSNGRVGFWGISYMGTTPWEAAIQGRDALKAIWAAGVITDWYLQGYDIQGRALEGYNAFTLDRYVGIGTPNWPLGVPSQRMDEYAAAAATRACPDTPRHVSRQAATQYADDRYPTWFTERRLVDHFGDVTAAVLVPHGQRDNSGHRFQEDIIWDALPNAPKWFVLGQWGHTIDFTEPFANYGYADDQETLTQVWFDFWLKGIGDAPRVGVVDYQDTAGSWHEADRWPPAAAVEALHLGAGGLGTDATGAMSFRAASATTNSEPLDDLAPGDQDFQCGPFDDPGTVLAYVSEPVTGTMAGNPYAILELESTRPGGDFRFELWATPNTDLCEDPGANRMLSRGGVDLRFHKGGYTGTDFPTDTPTTVRVDLFSMAATLKDHRLAVVLKPSLEPTAQPWNPTITIHGSSQLVLPFVEGTAGGVTPYPAPPRPFMPPS